MPVEVILPKVDMDMSHGTLAVWHVAPGEWVEKGAALFDIETDKAAMEVEAPASGHLQSISAQPGDKVAVGTVVALIYARNESVADPVAAAPTAAPMDVILPKVDMDMSHGTVAVWHVAEGDMVTKGAPLFDIETDKAAMEVEAPASGTLAHILAQPGDKVPVGGVVAWIYPAGVPVGARPQAPGENAEVPPVVVQPARAEKAVALAPDTGLVTATAGQRATPAARAAARQSGVTLAAIIGTGPLGRIQRHDVAAHLATSKVDARPMPEAVPVPQAMWSPQTGALHVSTRKGISEGTGKDADTQTPLLLLHGFTADSQSWAPLEKALGPDRPLLRIDLPGHGRSPRRTVSSFADLARMMVQAFDDATRNYARVHVLGHSLGGALALALADIRPRRVASLSLIAPAGLGPEIDAAALTGIVRATRAESLAPWLRRLTATPDGISDDYARAAMNLRADPALRAVQTAMAEALFPDGVQPFDLRPALARLDCATTMIWGQSDHILPQRHGISAPGDFALHLLAGAGHVPQIECPDRVARILTRHIAGASAA